MSELEIMVTGVAIVMGVLALLWGLTSAVGALVVGAGKVARRPLRKAGTETRTETEASIPPHHLAAIAAAAEAVFGKSHHIVTVSAPPHRVSAWMAAESNFGPASYGWRADH